MKTMKRSLALLLAVVLALALAMPAMAAAPTGSITVVPSDTVSLNDKTLKAYKILDATYSGTGDSQAISYTIPDKMKSFFDTYFSQTEGGNTKTATQLAAAAGMTLDAYVAQQMKDWADDGAQIKDFAYAALAAAKTAGVTAITGNKSGDNVVFANRTAGYYVIEDEGTATPISAVMLDTVTDAAVEITLKASDTTKKEVVTAGDLINSKADQLGLGRDVNFKITQVVPDYTGYDYFYYMINDKLSSGLTFKPETVKVTITKPAVEAKDAVGEPGTPGYQPAVAAQEAETTDLTLDQDYYLYYNNGAAQGDDDYDDDIATILGQKTFIIAFADIVNSTKIESGYTVTVTYSATVNSEAVTGVNPNTNDVNVQYSNNPDKDSKGDYDNDHPGIPKNDGNHPTGEGPHKFTDTYTTKLSIVKQDGTTKDKLDGVEFTLTGTSKDVVVNTEKVFEINPTGEYWLLNDGTYTKTAPQTAPTVRETTGGAGWVEVGASETVAAGVPVRVVGDKQYRPYVESTDSAKTRYVIVESNTGDYSSLTTKYAQVTKTTDDAEDYTVSRTGVTADGGKLDFSQLGAGTYKLSETGILAGYNGIKDIEFTITCALPDAENVVAGTEKAQWSITTTTPGVTFTPGDGDDLGTFTLTIDNNKGTELPSTGGIGTKIFYTMGAVLVIGAGVVLVSRKRAAE